MADATRPPVVDRHLAYMQGLGRTDLTIYQRRWVLGRLIDHLNGVDLLDATAEHVTAFLDRPDVRESVHKTERYNVRTFYRWAVSAGEISAEDDPTRDITDLPHPVGEPKKVALPKGRTVKGLVMRYGNEKLASGHWNANSKYQNEMKLWEFAKMVCEDPRQVNRAHVAKYLERPGISAGYRRGRLGALRGFCQWCVLNGYMKVDPTIGAKTPPVRANLPRAITPEQGAKVLAATPDARARLCVLLMLQEGLRRKEVAELQVGDVDLANASVLVRGKGGSGQITRVLPMSDETRAALNDYLTEHPASFGPLIRSYVRPDCGLTPHTVGELVSAWMAASGVKGAPGDGKSAHALRHSMANHMIDNGANVLEVQQALGHANLQTTQIYLRGRVEDLRKAMGGRKYRGANQ